MSEIQQILETADADVTAGNALAICTIIETRGSVPQCPGATMLVRHDGNTLGTLGGGCVEAEVRRRAFEMLLRGETGLLDYVLDHDYGWDDGLICGGRMKIAVMPLSHADQLGPIRAAVESARQRRPASFPVWIEHEARRLRYDVHIEVAPTLLIAGAGHVGQAVARISIDAGFHVVVIDDRCDLASPQRFGHRVELRVQDIPSALRDYPIDAECYVVIVTRGHQHDEQALEAVVRGPAGYIGLIGSRRKTRLIFDDLRALGVTEEQLARVHTPIGLDIGAITVPEIGISIVAELVQHRRQKTPRLVEGPFEVQS